MPKAGSSMRYSESSQRRWPRNLECRGWIHQETLCNGISVTFYVRQRGQDKLSLISADHAGPEVASRRFDPWHSQPPLPHILDNHK